MKLKNVLVPVDGSKGSLEAIDFVKDFFKYQNVKLHLIHIYEMNYYMVYTAELEGVFREAGQKILEEAIERAEGMDIESRLLTGTSYVDILDYSEREDIDMIVMKKSNKSRMEKYLVGSVTNKVLQHTKKPILII